ncbi:2854_t:CDS:2, partial [Diversispora eburnea]
MGARYGHEKKGDCMEYSDVVKRFNKKINIDYYTESLFVLCACFINYDDKYQPSPKSLLKTLDHKKKSKEKISKIVKELDEDKIGNIKDEELQKLAKKWLKNYIKELHAITHVEKICSSISEADITRPSGASTRRNDYHNTLDKIADSIRLKLSDLLSKLSKLN